MGWPDLSFYSASETVLTKRDSCHIAYTNTYMYIGTRMYNSTLTYVYNIYAVRTTVLYLNVIAFQLHVNHVRMAVFDLWEEAAHMRVG